MPCPIGLPAADPAAGQKPRLPAGRASGRLFCAAAGGGFGRDADRFIAYYFFYLPPSLANLLDIFVLRVGGAWLADSIYGRQECGDDD